MASRPPAGGLTEEGTPPEDAVAALVEAAAGPAAAPATPGGDALAETMTPQPLASEPDESESAGPEAEEAAAASEHRQPTPAAVGPQFLIYCLWLQRRRSGRR
jgi:hypothetical protein